jgi:preprotein translocase subunit SecA
MDYLREGINLRAMGQQDPLVAWQKEGYEMFEQMMAAIDDDYLRYVLHVQVVVEEPGAGVDLARASYQAAEDPVMESSMFVPVGAPPEQTAMNGDGQVLQQSNGRGALDGAPDGVNIPVTKSATAKLGRNEPCFCGSGKKFKLCHGRG